jgi:hypothetical protein
MTLTYVNPSFTATISWSTSTVATGYTVYIGTTSGASDIYSGTVSGQATASAAITSLTLTPNSSYYATIIATNTYGSSTATSSVAVTALTDLYIFSSITFTPAGYTGRNGPIKSACVSAYSATNSWVSNTAYFNMTTNGFQLWTVPSTAGYRFVVAGARGGGGGGGNYGRGGVATVDISLTKGDIIRIVVGQMGIGSNGGCGSSPYDHGGGGGGTYVYNNTTSTLLIAIGGGGGGGSSYVQNSMNAAVSSTSGNTGMSSGGAGGSGGGGGNAGSSGCTGDFGGGGGGYSSNGGSYGGNGGAAFVNGSVGGAAGSYGAEGGFGGGGGGSTYCGNGGGGYSGGGGGALSQCSCATLGAGGGGGSYFINAVSSSSSTNTGAGYVSVTKLSFGPPATVTTSLSYSAQTVTVLWDTSYSATSYTVTIYQNPTNSTIGGTSLGSATTANLTYTFTGISSLTLTQYVYATVYATTSGPINSAVTISNTVLVVAITYLNYLLTTFFANTGSIPDSSGPSGYGGNGTNWGAMIQAGQALNPILFGNNRSYLPAGYSNYSALTTGFVYSATTTTIVFRGVTDDGLIVNFNGTNVINQYQQQGATSYSSGTLTLPAGYTPIRITWYDTGGGGQYDIFITVGGGTETSDGTGYFYRTSTATY